MIPTSFGVQLPSWVVDEVGAVSSPDVEERMRLVHRLAARNPVEGLGGPFAALVSDQDGHIVSAGVNLVLASNISSSHAEILALTLAQTRLGTWDLSSAAGAPYELMVNWRPCVMCYGAVVWSGVQQLTIAGSGPELEELTGFDEGPMRDDWRSQLEERGISVRDNVLREEALAVFREYGERSDVTVYNARGTK
ncbi:nucleoside deaminase [Actinocrispum sp. NPDC049592]|uniref:nucleoside deaminase n=1 Tax=Actinocrispum sp. NPDC049592 TaxID=3154835 RepID=UPI0034413E8D